MDFPNNQTDPNLPITSVSEGQPADLVVSRSAGSEAEPQFEPVVAPAPTVGSDAYDDINAPHTLNATPGADPLVAPDIESQRTGRIADPVYRAPGMTSGSAINQLEVMWGELVTKLNDFDHDLSGLPDDLAALVDFVKSRTGTKA